jgi:hypothetical protein
MQHALQKVRAVGKERQKSAKNRGEKPWLSLLVNKLYRQADACAGQSRVRNGILAAGGNIEVSDYRRW